MQIAGLCELIWIESMAYCLFRGVNLGNHTTALPPRFRMDKCIHTVLFLMQRAPNICDD